VEGRNRISKGKEKKHESKHKPQVKFILSPKAYTDNISLQGRGCMKEGLEKRGRHIDVNFKG
jgi:hypothetical protein